VPTQYGPAAQIASALGLAHRSGGWWRCRCPVHGSRGATLALRDGGRALIAICHAGCACADILGELRRCGLLDGLEGRPPLPATRDDDSGRRIEIARRIWGAVRDARGSPVAAYLTGRGITIAPPSSLRYAHALRRPDDSYGPAMVARIDGPDRELVGIHRTWLDRGPDGVWRRRDRAMLGRAAGGAVRLASAAETLLIGEGIETTLAGMQATGLPGWAALSTSGMTALVMPGMMRDVLILVDRDPSGAGERAARTAGRRWFDEGRRVRLVIPHVIGADAADLIRAAAGNEARRAA
jgi:putative DNA primase/helicase